MSEDYIYKNCRHPHTTQEKRQNERDAKYVRGKRSVRNLVEVRDDISLIPEKGWKQKKRGKQYEKFSKGEKFVVDARNLSYTEYTYLFREIQRNGYFYKVKGCTLTYWK